MFDKSPHPTLRQSSPTKQLHCVCRGLLCGLRAMHLEECHLTAVANNEYGWEDLRDMKLPSELIRLDTIRHRAHLVRDALEPVLRALSAGDHCRQPAYVGVHFLTWISYNYLLMSHHGLIHKWLSERFPLTRPPVGLSVDNLPLQVMITHFKHSSTISR